MNAVKLIIWDLDETFWKGTISDNERIERPEENIRLVKQFTDRGIVNSICSKNDFSVVCEILKSWNIWEYFVFPSIDWTPKGERIKRIIEDMNLRPVNCLFIDDNVHNLEEASFSVPGIQTTTPDNFLELLDDEAFRGKDDHEHERLNQYKILEKKVSDRSGFSSNLDFLEQSNIQVELITDCSDKLERIHEMIHRNNQLNFTKDRISMEEVQELFTDSTVTSGVVRVIDKYGDHGLVGCYAVKDGKALQLVLSCRILGMGVEQWLYARLGYPDIEVRGEVAATLTKSYMPEYIHEKEAVSIAPNGTVPSEPETSNASILLYGNCQVRTIWGFISSRYPNTRLEWLDPGACVCNLAALFRCSKEKIDYFLKNVPSLSKFTFDEGIVSGTYEYVIASLNDYSIWRKYENKEDGSYFYSGIDLDEKNASKDFCTRYEKTELSAEDIASDLDYLCKNLYPVKLILLNCPNVKFPGNDEKELKNRLEMNRIADELVKENANAALLDIRKHAKYLSDFFDASPNHFTRNVAYDLSKDIENVISPLQGRIHKDVGIQIPKNHLCHDEIIENIKIRAIIYLCNGILSIQVQMPNVTEYTFSYTVIENGFEIIHTENQEGEFFKTQISRASVYEFGVDVYKDGTLFHKLNINKRIVYSVLNYMLYTDPCLPNYDHYMDELPKFIQSSEERIAFRNYLISKISLLMSENVSMMEYFASRRITEISVLTNKEIGKVLLPWCLRSTGLKLKKVYTSDQWGSDRFGDGAERIPIIHVSRFSLNPGSVLLYADDPENYSVQKGYFKERKIKIISLRNCLTALMTRHFFTRRLHDKNKKNVMPKVIALRFPLPYILSEFLISKLRPNERALFTFASSEQKSLDRIEKNYDNFQHLQKAPLEKWRGTMVRPSFSFHPVTRVPSVQDMNSTYVNVRSGFRITSNQPWAAIGDVYIFGNKNAFGVGCADDETIASCLQSILGRSYRVHNYANHWGFRDFHFSLWLYDHMQFHENDIVIFLVHPTKSLFWVTRDTMWLNWQYIEAPVLKVDAFPLFNEPDRPDYFIAPDAVNAECNMELAKLLRDAIHKNILPEADILYGKIVRQTLAMEGCLLRFKMQLSEDISAIYEFCLYRGNELWEKRPPTKIPEAAFTIDGDKIDGEYHIEYTVQLGNRSQTYRSSTFRVQK